MVFASEPKPGGSNKSYLKEVESTSPKGTFPPNGKKHVLVVDDDATIRALLYDALSTLGCEVMMASGGTEGFKHFSQNNFDLVITDCIMPGTDGWQLAALIKQVCIHTPVIMITGQNEDEVRPKMQDGNIDFLILKPIKLDIFYETVQASFEMKHGTGVEGLGNK